jgi:hypothetical protein
MLRRFLHVGFLALVCTALAVPAFPSPALAGEGGGSKPKRSKVIDFEDELVEGMNKRPLDSLSQIGDAARRKKKPHLYRKRIGFRAETLETLRESRYVQ